MSSFFEWREREVAGETVSRDQQLRNDLYELEHLLFKPGLMTLWDVYRVNAHLFVSACERLSYIEGMVDEIRNDNPDKREITVPPIQEYVQDIRNISKKMNLKRTEERTEDLLRLLQGNQVDAARLTDAISLLHHKFIAELKEQVLLLVREDHAKYYLGRTPFLGKQILQALPDIKDEDRRARKCFAMEEYTECGFHLMRIMEYVVQCFTTKVGLTFNPEEDSWGNILGRVHCRINTWNRNHPNRPYKKKVLACHRLMDGMKSERNDLIHRRQNYSEDDAANLKGLVMSSIRAYLKVRDLDIVV